MFLKNLNEFKLIASTSYIDKFMILAQLSVISYSVYWLIVKINLERLICLTKKLSKGPAVS